MPLTPLGDTAVMIVFPEATARQLVADLAELRVEVEILRRGEWDAEILARDLAEAVGLNSDDLRGALLRVADVLNASRARRGSSPFPTSAVGLPTSWIPGLVAVEGPPGRERWRYLRRDRTGRWRCVWSKVCDKVEAERKVLELECPPLLALLEPPSPPPTRCPVRWCPLCCAPWDHCDEPTTHRDRWSTEPA